MLYFFCLQAGSGVAVKDEVAEIAKVMNTKKNIQYVVFKLTNDLTAVEVEKVAQKGMIQVLRWLIP